MELIDQFIEPLAPAFKLMGVFILGCLLFTFMIGGHGAWSAYRAKRRRKLHLKSQGRLIEWKDVRSLLDRPSGTLICSGLKEPKFWWTDDDIFQNAPDSLPLDLDDPEYEPFYNWIYVRHYYCCEDPPHGKLINHTGVKNIELEECLLEFDSRRQFLHAANYYDFLPDRHKNAYDKRDARKKRDREDGTEMKRRILGWVPLGHELTTVPDADGLTPPDSPNSPSVSRS